MKPEERNLAIDHPRVFLNILTNDLRYSLTGEVIVSWPHMIADAHSLTLAFPDNPEYLEAELSILTRDSWRALRQYRKIWRELEREWLEPTVKGTKASPGRRRRGSRSGRRGAAAGDGVPEARAAQGGDSQG